MMPHRPNPVYADHLRLRLEQMQVPDHLRIGLVQYLAARRPVGQFLSAVLSNDLCGALLRADDESRTAIGQLVVFLVNYAPSPAWGSRQRLEAWLADPEPALELFE